MTDQSYEQDLFDDNLLTCRTVNFQKFVLHLRRAVSKHVLDCAVSVAVEEIADHIILDIRRELWSQHPGPGMIKVNYPKTWWQHFKLHWFPKWLLKKYPVVYEVRKIDVQILYPTLNIAFPHKQAIVSLVDWGTGLQKSSDNLLGEGYATFDR